MRKPVEIEGDYNYFAGKPVTTVDELPTETSEIKEDTLIYKKNSAGNEITLYIFKDKKFFEGPTFTEV